MNDAPEVVMHLTKALYDTLTTQREGMNVREVYFALAMFYTLALHDGERLLKENGEHELAARLRADFLALCQEAP